MPLTSTRSIICSLFAFRLSHRGRTEIAANLFPSSICALLQEQCGVYLFRSPFLARRHRSFLTLFQISPIIATLTQKHRGWGYTRHNQLLNLYLRLHRRLAGRWPLPQWNFTYSKSTGWALMPRSGGAIHPAIFPRSKTPCIRLCTNARSAGVGSQWSRCS